MLSRRRIWPLLGVLLLTFAPAADGAREIADQARRSLVHIPLDSPWMPVLLLLGAALIAATFYFPRFGLMVMLLFIMVATDMPIGGEPGGGRTVTLRGEDLVLLLVTFGWFLNRSRTKTLTIIKAHPVYPHILAMSLVMVAATTIGYFQGTTSFTNGFLFTMKRLEYFWIFIMAYNLLETDADAYFSLKILLVVSLVVAGFGAVQYLFFPLSQFVEKGATATAGAGRGNTFGDFLLIVLAISIAMTIHAANLKRTALMLAVVFVFALALLLTRSRGAYVSVPPMLVVIFIFSRRIKTFLPVSLGLVMGLLYLLVASFGSSEFSFLAWRAKSDIGHSVSSIGDVAARGAAADSSFNARVLAWRHYMSEFQDYPLFGQGCGAVPLGHIDNQYVRELVETGLLGFAAFIFMNLGVFMFMLDVHGKTRRTPVRALALGFIGAHAALMVHGVTMSNFYTIFNMEVFWFLFAIISVLRHNELSAEAAAAGDAGAAPPVIMVPGGSGELTKQPEAANVPV